MKTVSLEQTDEDIARQVQVGDVQAFGVLVTRYQDKIIRYGHKFLSGYADIEDVAQEVFIKAYENIKSFDPDRKFSSWIYRIAHNEFINTIKKIGREPLPFFDPDTLFPHPLSHDFTDRGILSREAREILSACLEKISAKYREVLVLFYIEELSYQEIADVLHVPLATVGVRLKRARDLLKNYCQKNGYDPKL